MITAEEFKEIYDKSQNDQDISKEEVKALLDVILELDRQAIHLQQAVMLAYDNTRVVVESLAERILERTGRTDQKIRKSVAKIAAAALARYEIAIQMFLSGALADDIEQAVNSVEEEAE